MKRAILLTTILIMMPVTVFSHPGKTDFRGGHKCLKGCEAWGLFYKEYHLHDKDGNAIRIKKVRKQQQKISHAEIASAAAGTVVQVNQPVTEPVATYTPVQELPEGHNCTSNALLYLVLLLLVLLLLVRMNRKREKR